MFRFRRGRLFTHVAAYEGVLGTSLDLRIVADCENTAVEVEARILSEIDRLDSVFSNYRSDSEFMLWQESQGEPVSVSRDLATVLEDAEKWRVTSEGAFLPVVEELTRRWRIRETEDREDEIVSIDPTAPEWTVQGLCATRLTRHAASLNAIAKGYIIDRAVELAMENPGVDSVYVNIGGDVRHSGNGSVTVAITDPRSPADNGTPLCSVNASNMGVASSGGYRRGFSIGGERHSHIFDPRVGRPIEMLRSASVIAPTTMLADIFATIVVVLQPNEGLAFADRIGSVGALVVDNDGNCHQNLFWTQSLVSRRTPKPK